MNNNSKLIEQSEGGSLKLALTFASRYVLTRSNSSMSAFISKVSMTGLAIAVALLIVVLSIMNGFERDMRERILGLLPQISLYSLYQETDWESVTDIVERNKNVIASAPFINLQGLLVKGRKTEAALLVGIDPLKEAKVSIIDQYISSETLVKLQNNMTIIGQGLANKLNLKKGASVVFLMPQNDEGSTTPQLIKLKVLDILDSGTEIDRHAILLNINTSVALSKNESQALRITTDNLFDVQNISAQIMNELPNSFLMSDWTQTHGNLYAAIALSKRLIVFLIFIVITVAMFNIISSLVLLVNNKRSDIAILQTMGMSPRYIMVIFLFQGSVIALIGTLLGVLLGLLLTFSINGIVQLIEQLFSYTVLNPDVYPLNYFPVDVRITDIVYVCFFSTLIGVVTTIYPALKASNVLPAEALTNAKA